MAALQQDAKRPYIRPRVGSSALRTLWHLLALVGIVAIALLIPRARIPAEGINGTWDVRLQGTPGGLPDGQAVLIVSHARYALAYAPATAGAAARIEYGDLLQDGGTVEMRPVSRAGFEAGEGGQGPRVFAASLERGRLALTTPGGGSLTGVPLPVPGPRSR